VLKVTVNVRRWLDHKEFEQVTETAVRSYVRDVFFGAVNRSPVYTGSFRASWRIGFREPDESTTTGGAPEAPLPRPVFYWPKGYRLGDMVYISNSQPYALRIENGYSMQAPTGVLALSVASASVRK
jgi:hypothetical protein